MRKCDHQAVQNGYMVKLAKGEGFSYPVPQIIATYLGEKTTPVCNKMTFED
jgi:branched-chain amino acid transport system substrate-binding protein